MNSTQQHPTSADFHRSIETQPAGKPCGGDPAIEVGAVRQAEGELDDAICELGLKSEAAMAAGDPDGARSFSDRMYAAIRSRTPEHQARLEAEIQQRIDDGVGFFGSPASVAMGRLPAHG
jgi:hypothetical protein